LNQLHAALTPEQRAVLVDKVIAHWQVWKAANAQEEKAGDTTHLGQLDWVAKDLSLRPDQVEKIRATFAASLSGLPRRFDSAQAQAHIDELATAFKAPTFDAKTLQHAPFVNQHLALWGARRMASFYEAIDPLLTGDQRTKLSAELKLHATAKSGVFDAEKHER
jgi:Spy/CpxP family protein refolding chaperone